jgi:hypothetical protein
MPLLAEKWTSGEATKLPRISACDPGVSVPYTQVPHCLIALAWPHRPQLRRFLKFLKVAV